jgi:hypothetical protein
MSAQLGDELPVLVADPNGQVWHVSSGDSNRARSELWSILQAPTMFR